MNNNDNDNDNNRNNNDNDHTIALKKKQTVWIIFFFGQDSRWVLSFLSVILTEQYPLEQPLLYVQSIYLINNTLYKKSVTGYRYDPSWSEQEKIEKVKYEKLLRCCFANLV